MAKTSRITVEQFKESLKVVFPVDEVDGIADLCIRDGDDFWGHNHIDVFAELCGLNENDILVEKFRVPYILFTNHYFLLDAAVDQHFRKETDVLYITHLLISSLFPIFEEAAIRLDNLGRRQLLQVIGTKVSANARAIRDEVVRRNRYYGVADDDYQVIVGRSNSTVLFYELICILTHRIARSDIKDILFDLIYYMQLGDDVGDWRKDFEDQNFTPLLQRCLRNISEVDRFNIQAVEKELYLNGVFEFYIREIILGLDNLKTRLLDIEGVQYSNLLAYIEERRSIAYALLHNMLEAKLDALSMSDV